MTSTTTVAATPNASGTEEVILTEASAATTVLATSTGEVTAEGAGLVLTTEDGIRVEHVTVEPMDVVTVEETLVVEEEEGVTTVAVEHTHSHPVGEEVAVERLNEEQTVEVQVGEVTHVTMTDGHMDPEVHVETVEVDESGVVQTVQV